MPERVIALSNGGVARIDEQDYATLSAFVWRRHPNGYAYRVAEVDGARRFVLMHRVILGVQPGVLVDHHDGDGLNNCRRNLRPCTMSQNQANRRNLGGGSSRYKGVYWDAPNRKWAAQTKVNGKKVFLGRHATEDAAARAYDAFMRSTFGEFARPNLPEGV